jgi:2-hydroxychromene-2-carboxylate isomerase
VSEPGEDVAAFRAAIAAPALKQRLIDETESASTRGVFGAPTFFFGDEMFWGNDRLAVLEAIVRASGWGALSRA